MFSVLAIIILPETRGKSLEQIQDYFEGKSLKASNGKDKDNYTVEVKTKGKKTCSKVGESILSSVPIVVAPPAKELSLAIEKEEITKL